MYTYNTHLFEMYSFVEHSGKRIISQLKTLNNIFKNGLISNNFFSNGCIQVRPLHTKKYFGGFIVNVF